MEYDASRPSTGLTAPSMIDSLSGQSTGGSLSSVDAVAPQLLTPEMRYGRHVEIRSDFAFPAPSFDPHAGQWHKGAPPLHDAYYAL